MHVLVTGGAGFIGSHLVEELLHLGHNIRVFDNFSTGYHENLLPWKDHIEIIEADLREADKVSNAVSDTDWVFHLAAFISVPQSIIDPQTCFSINVNGTLNLLEASRLAGVRKVVIASSTAVYGDPKVFPTPEDAPLQPLSPYAASKQVNEIYASLYTRVLNLPVVPLRFFNVYGPRQRPDSPYAAAIPIFIDKLMNGKQLTIFGDGRQSRDFIFVKDVVRANILAAGSETAGEPINICSGEETTLLDLMEELSEVTTQQPEVRFAPPRPGDIYRSLGDPLKAKNDLFFKSQISLGDGLKEILNLINKQ